ncbi:MAG: FAD-dependent oxidoreductase [Phycisphaerae bacterium]|nr:FAD-dependent oxidoreductase [Phycisphaerae bacterium]
MKFQITQLSMDLEYTDESVLRAVRGRLIVAEPMILSCTVVRRSIDARRIKRPVCFTLTVDVEMAEAFGTNLPASWKKMRDIKIIPDSAPSGLVAIQTGASSAVLPYRPVVVGAGPAGLLAAWRLAQAGLQPILIERGVSTEQRHSSVKKFWSQGVLNEDDNVLFGEGGAGLYSDGKLTTQSKLRAEMRTVLELLVQCGADESILIDAEPHLGSDRLGQIVPNLRQRIIAAGGDVRFGAKLEGLETDGGQLTGVIVNGEQIETRNCILATGHSARDVYHMLHRDGVTLAPKPFAVGVRVEMPQPQIDKSQFGQMAGHERLGAANFRLTRKPQGRHRACYSFCMCPGGMVIACASSPGMLTTNGMSLSHRSSGYGNAAFLVPVEPGDFGGAVGDPLAGIAWQGKIEAKAFEAGGGDFTVPGCALDDFLARRDPRALSENREPLRAVAADIHAVLPNYITQTLRNAIGPMMRQMQDVDPKQCTVYAAETRSSSPLRILRDESFQSPSVRGLYPVGEGAGYAGGIVTSAIDGLRAAESLCE